MVAILSRFWIVRCIFCSHFSFGVISATQCNFLLGEKERSEVPIQYPLFVLKGGGKSVKILPAKILELAPKGYYLLNIIPSGFLKKLIGYRGKGPWVPRKYRKAGICMIEEIYFEER